jgi:hypothetical protein
MRGRRAMWVALAGIAACKPELLERPSRVDAPTLLAMRGDPAEAAPGEPVTYTLVVAGPDGPLQQPSASWSYCTAPRPLGENNSVSAACLDDSASPALGPPAPSLTAALPDDACARFGPDPPPGDFRPRDPDGTGGYYQPLRVQVDGVEGLAFGLERVSCSLANAPIDVVQEFQARYTPNRNPELLPLVARIDGAPASLDAIPAGAIVELVAAWPASAAETYVRFDARTQALVEARESLRVSWFATGGDLEHDRTGRAADDLATETTNLWTAPVETGVVHVWVVLRDARGGVASLATELQVVATP